MGTRLAIVVLVGVWALPVEAGGWKPPRIGPRVTPGSIGCSDPAGGCGLPPGGCGGGCCALGRCLDGVCNLFHSTGDMPQHLPYVNPYHGYYYFRPYNYIHIAQHQQEIQAMGGDARNPYDNRFFQKIYQEFEEEAAPVPPVEPPPPPESPPGEGDEPK